MEWSVEWTPEFIDRLGWSVKNKSRQEELLVWICVGSFINWEKPFEEAVENSFVPSAVLISLGHQEEDLALKSPVITDKNGLRLFISIKKIFQIV